jgi:hypothetical protein
MFYTISSEFRDRLVVFMIAYLIYLPQRRLKRRVALLVKTRRSQLPSRVAESLLVRWAEEDMGIEGEQDFMVNDRQDLDLDEQIPLKPSPGRLSSPSMNYGSAKN